MYSARRIALAAALVAAVALPFAFTDNTFLGNAIVALAYTVMALGLNVVVGFAGLLDLGYVAVFAIGAYNAGWFASAFFASISNGKGIHIPTGTCASSQPGIHLNFVLV